MSESSGRPVQRVSVVDGAKPRHIPKRLMAIFNDQEQATEQATEPTPMTDQKPTDAKSTVVPPAEDWKTNLPDWLKFDMPTSRGYYRIKWTIFSWLFYRNGKNPKLKSSPKFFGYVSGFWENHDFVQETRRASEAIVTVGSADGGMGKTTAATLLAAMRKKATERPVLAYDGDASHPNIMMWYDIKDDGALTTNQLAAYLEESGASSPYFTDLNKWCADDPDTHVMVIDGVQGKFLDAAKTSRNIRAIKPSVHTLVTDSQPGLFEDDAATYAQIECADIVLIAGIGSSHKGREAIKVTLDYEPYQLRNQNGRVADHVLIVVNSVEPRDFNTRTRFKLAGRYNATPDQIILIPTCQYLNGMSGISEENEQDKINKVRIQSLDPRTRYAVSYLDRRVSELAIAINSKRMRSEAARASKPQPTHSHALVKAPFPPPAPPRTPVSHHDIPVYAESR